MRIFSLKMLETQVYKFPERNCSHTVSARTDNRDEINGL